MIDWAQYKFYAFPPFALIDRVLQKIKKDQGTGILIVPKWTTQPWYPGLLKLLVQEPLPLPFNNKILELPYKPSCSTSVGPQTGTHGLQLIKQSLARKGLVLEAVEVIMSLW